MADWLYLTTLEVTLLIGLVLILRTMVRCQLGAHISYWLWLIPLARSLMWCKPERPSSIIETAILPNGDFFLSILPTSSRFSIPDYFLLEWIWLAGFLFWGSIRIISWRHLQSYLKRHSVHVSLPESMQTFAKENNQCKSISYFTTTIQSAPFVTGLRKPRIYLPERFFGQYNQLQQQCVLTHELTHVKRKDLWVQVVGELVRAVFWFNPIVHLAWTAFQEDQEFACDRDVLRHSNDEERYEYGRALVRSYHTHILQASLAFFSKKKERFIMLEKHRNSNAKNILGITLCVLIGIFALTKGSQALEYPVNWTHDQVKLNFKDMQLHKLVGVLFELTDKEVVGLSQLKNRQTTINVNRIIPYDALTLILKCNGYKMIVQDDDYRIVKDKKIAVDASSANKCIASKIG